MEPKPNTIDTEASRWAVRLDAGALSAEEQAELDRWVSSDRRHHGALVRARAAWLDADRLGALAAGTMTEPTPLGPARYRPWVIAASLAAVAVLVGALTYTHIFSGETYASEVGEVRRIELADGSELTLNTNTHATVRFREEERDIALKQGEALFKVAHDASRPFIVRANDVQVKAVGTAFTVRVDDARVDVVVSEGVVEVSRAGSVADIRRVTANHRVVVASRESRLDIESINAEGMTRQLAWREGMVAFAGEPLSVAVAEINRHSRQPIVVDDPALAGRPVIGIFHANDAQGFASATAATFGAEVVRVDGVIHLRSAARP